MAVHVPNPPVLLEAQRTGTRVFSGLEECALRHAPALAQLAHCLRSCYGPAGSLKLLVTRSGRTLISGNSLAILSELEIEHPAGSLARQGCQTQAQECGDGTATVLLLAGALMSEAEILLRAGMPATELCCGYRLACAHACQELVAQSLYPWAADGKHPIFRGSTSADELSGTVCQHESSHHPMPSAHPGCLPLNLLPSGELRQTLLLRYTLAYAATTALTFPLLKGTACNDLVEQACSVPIGDDPESLQVLGFPGGSMDNSWVVKGAVLQLEPLGTTRGVDSARVALYMCPFGEQRTKGTGTTLIELVQELEELGAGREQVERRRVESLSEAGVTLLAVAGAVSELALHFCNQAGILVVKLERRSQARQLALASGAQVLTTDQRAPEPEDIGHCQRVYPTEIGEEQTLVFESGHQVRGGQITVVVRAATPHLVEACKEVIRSAVQCYRALREEPRMVVGAGAIEMELSLHLERLGQHHPGLEQQGLLAFSRALVTLPRTLARNWGLDEMRVMGELRVRHERGEVGTGIREDGVVSSQVLDPLMVKRRALQLATDVAVTLIGCGEVLVAKKSGGPKFQKENRNWDLEPDFID
ncbi:T-complex protein 1 subunit theta-like [Pseudophryne corroboree]|uniref:T-complex protein 1 subunit theta-like n=1 Tax=Pseudophryne corroboree TaxID=495146 RepID=UPI003081404C